MEIVVGPRNNEPARSLRFGAELGEYSNKTASNMAAFAERKLVILSAEGFKLESLILAQNER